MERRPALAEHCKAGSEISSKTNVNVVDESGDQKATDKAKRHPRFAGFWESGDEEIWYTKAPIASLSGSEGQDKAVQNLQALLDKPCGSDPSSFGTHDPLAACIVDNSAGTTVTKGHAVLDACCRPDRPASSLVTKGTADDREISSTALVTKVCARFDRFCVPERCSLRKDAAQTSARSAWPCALGDGTLHPALAQSCALACSHLAIEGAHQKQKPKHRTTKSPVVNLTWGSVSTVASS